MRWSGSGPGKEATTRFRDRQPATGNRQPATGGRPAASGPIEHAAPAAAKPGGPIYSLKQERARLEAEWATAAEAGKLARAHADLFDRALKRLVEEQEIAGGWALVALGGYGRQELCPYSDVDLMLLCRRPTPGLKRLAEAIYYPLWDAGVEVGHAVRTVGDCLKLTTSDLAAQTSLLDARLVAGDPKVLDQLMPRLLARLRSRRAQLFLKRLLAANSSRHARYGEAAYRLEPHLKEGQGGLRDLQAIHWAGGVALDCWSLPDLAREGWLEQREAAELEASHELLLGLRGRLHRLSGRKNDQLYFPLQEEIAASLIPQPGDNRLPVEALMSRVHEAADTVGWIAAGFWERLLARDRGGAILAEPGPEIAWSAALHECAQAAGQGRQLSYAFQRQVKSARQRWAGPVEWTPRGAEDFLGILGSGEAALPVLEAMGRSSLLGFLIPEWEGVRFLAHHDLYHLHTVDLHGYQSVAELGKMAQGGYPAGDDLPARLMAELPDPDLLRLATLLHDLGKAQPGEHSGTGAELGERIALRMGFPKGQAAEIAFLIRHHALLPRVAARRDLGDEELILRLADTVGAPDRLKALYLLAMADALATGPGAWNDWKASLLRELFFKLLHVMERGEYAGQDSRDRMAAALQQVRIRLGLVHESETVERFLEAMPFAYLASQPAEAIVRHFELLQGDLPSPVRAQPTPSGHPGQYELALASADRPGLLWRICGVLALHGVNILEARAYTRSDRVAIDLFQVADAFEPEISAQKWKRIVADMEKALTGKLSLPSRLAEKLRHYQRVSSGPPVETRIQVDNSASDFYSVVEVFAPDRLGLLYRIARALSELQLDIHLAKISTRGSQAVDVFYVQDLFGRKIADQAHCREVEKAVLFEVGQDG